MKTVGLDMALSAVARCTVSKDLGKGCSSLQRRNHSQELEVFWSRD